MKFIKKSYFGSFDESRIPILNDYQKKIDINISNIHNYQYPLFDGSYTYSIYDFLNDKKLNKECLSPESTIDYMTFYFENLPDYCNPGTMINVIPTVNLISSAVSNVAELFNPNGAQDTYSGNLLLAELEVIKYMSDQIGWNWKKSTGVFTFGGTGTNLYATKLSLVNADPNSSKQGCKENHYFSITSKNGHPSHYQVCDWLGIGSDSCIEVDCKNDGSIDVCKTRKIINDNIKKGKIFLGFNLTGGSTNELYIDPIKEIYDLREEIIQENNLLYKPLIHVDSVLGWSYLFFKDYNFSDSTINISDDAQNLISSIYNKIKQLVYADTIGIDFHKTGFCPYISSLFIVKDKQNYFKLNPEKEYNIEDMNYGDYNPFYTSLEYSRSCKGPIAALSCLKSLGKDGFCHLISELTDATLYFRKLLMQDNRIFVFEPNINGYATIFTLIPIGINLENYEDFKNCSADEIKIIRNLNSLMGKKILHDCLKHSKNFIFTSSRSYILPRTSIKIGALKAYPMSVFFTKKEAKRLYQEIITSIDELYSNNSSNKIYKNNELFDDMSISND